MKKRHIYLDYAATCPVDPRVVKAMQPYFFAKAGNNMSLHSDGQRANEAIEEARRKILKAIGGKNGKLVFTGSATESNNLAIFGLAFANKEKKQIIVSAIEHDCVLNSAKSLEKAGYKLDFLEVDKKGRVKLDQLAKMIGKETLMVSVMQANNEMGTIQDISKIGEICKKAGVYFHSDAAQSFGREPIDVEKMGVDLLTLSSHKIYGPKGVAGLWMRQGVEVEPIIYGGGQEGGLRSGTMNTAAIVGWGAATEIAIKEMKRENKRLLRLREKLITGILKNISGTELNGDRNKRLANNVNISFRGIEGESLLLELDDYGVMVSTGSACSSASLAPSHVLMAMGAGEERAHGSIRFSLGRWTKSEEIDYLLKILPKAVARLRRVSVL
ncbi:cysteine desulfurase [Patescibacteria group bacterium]|nr:cysteine desulfurase [Patescibacteria group bacterium]